MKKYEYERVVPVVSPTSSFHSLTKFLLFSFRKRDRRLVEGILLEREKGLKDELHKLKQESEKTEHGLRMELDFSRENYAKDLQRERDIFKSKLSWAEIATEKLQEKLTRESHQSLEILVKLEKDLEDEVEKRQVREKEFEEILVKREKELRDEVEKREIREKEWQREFDLFENKLLLAEKEKMELVEKVRKEYEGRIEELEGVNRELNNKIELRNETLGKEFAMVEERLAKLKGVFGSVCSGETDRGSGNGVGRAVSITDSHDKASNLESFLVKSQSSPGDPSFKAPPKVESRGSDGITIGVQLEVKTESSFLEYEAEGKGCSEKNINCKRKRSIDETEGDKDSSVVNKKIEHLHESGCKKISLPINFSTHGVSKASSPPRFSSTCMNQCKEKNRRQEIPELLFTKSKSGVVDVTNRCSRGGPDEASPENKAVVGSQSGKEVRWKHKGDMLSAFGNHPELCMAAVCALYRQTISARVSRNSGGFCSFDIVSGTAAAKYLINNDPRNKLSRSVLEVQQNRPSVLKLCQRLAIQYDDQLFKIYQKELDPLFCPKS